MFGKKLAITALGIQTILAGYWIYSGYLRSDLIFIVGMLLIPLFTLVRARGQASLRFGWVALAFAVTSLYLPVRTFHFWTLAFSGLFVVENWHGKINSTPVLIIILMSAVVKSLSLILSLPARLQLSRMAVQILQHWDPQAMAEGNIIHYKQGMFAVDPACMGLQMLEVSFLFAFILLAYFEKQEQKRLPMLATVGLLPWALFLNLAYNLIRILILVMFKIMPETPMHDIVGLAGLLLYVFIPLYFSTRFCFNRFGKTVLSVDNELVKRSIFKKRLAGLLLLSLAGFCLYFTDQVSHGADKTLHSQAIAVVPAGLPRDAKMEKLEDGVVKYQADSLLVYVKAIRGFYTTEHTPLVCWQGSGFSFEKIQEADFEGIPYYTGILKNKEQRLYTAWWYDNGTIRTIDQFRWRWLDLGGAPGFSLINVTASDPLQLQQQLAEMLRPASLSNDLSRK